MESSTGPLRILYHHRTQGEDAQGVHIHEIIRQFRALGHEVEECALVPAGDGPHLSAATKQRGRFWSFVSRVVPDVAYEIMEMSYDLVGSRRLARAIRRFRPDFIYERYSLYTSCGVRAARRFGIPILLEVNAPLASEQEALGKLTFRKRARAAERRILEAASRVIVVSTPMKEIFVEMGIAPDRMVVVPNGVDPEQFHGRDTGDAVRSRYGLPRGRVIGFVGWVRRWHGLAELVGAMGRWRDQLADVHLLVVGDGPARPDIEAAAASAGVSDRVHVTGPIDRASMPDHIAAIDVALQPAATSYASPMKVLEYLAMGKPVVACDQPNLRELLPEGTVAEFFEPGNHAELARVLGELMVDPARLERMGRAARRHVLDAGRTWRANAEIAVALARQAGAGGAPGVGAAGSLS